MMIEMKWLNGKLYFRQRDFQVDASTHFCGLTDFGSWQEVPVEKPGDVRDGSAKVIDESVRGLRTIRQTINLAAAELTDANTLTVGLWLSSEMRWMQMLLDDIEAATRSVR